MSEHLDDNGEMLPHLLLADVTRYLVAQYLEDAGRKIVRDLLSHLEAELAVAMHQNVDMRDDNTANLIGVSFVENLPAPLEAGYDIRHLLGPTLARSYDEWFGLGACGPPT